MYILHFYRPLLLSTKQSIYPLFFHYSITMCVPLVTSTSFVRLLRRRLRARRLLTFLGPRIRATSRELPFLGRSFAIIALLRDILRIYTYTIGLGILSCRTALNHLHHFHSAILHYTLFHTWMPSTYPNYLNNTTKPPDRGLRYTPSASSLASCFLSSSSSSSLESALSLPESASSSSPSSSCSSSSSDSSTRMTPVCFTRCLRSCFFHFFVASVSVDCTVASSSGWLSTKNVLP